MVQPYKVGYCPSCGDNIMVADSNGRMNAFRRNFRQVDLEFENSATKVRTIMCSKCYEDGFNKDDVLASILDENSQATSENVKQKISEFGRIKEFRLSPTYQGETIRDMRRTADTGSRFTLNP